MRDAINNNPIAQMAVVGVLLVITGLMLMMGPLKGRRKPPRPMALRARPLPRRRWTGRLPLRARSPTATPVVPGPPLPRQVTAAQQAGKVVALLVVRAGGPDDRLLRGAVDQAFAAFPGLAFFATRAEGIARYARITQGVDVDRVPALVVVRPPGRPAASPAPRSGTGSATPPASCRRSATSSTRDRPSATRPSRQGRGEREPRWPQIPTQVICGRCRPRARRRPACSTRRIAGRRGADPAAQGAGAPAASSAT